MNKLPKICPFHEEECWKYKCCLFNEEEEDCNINVTARLLSDFLYQYHHYEGKKL